MTSQLNGLLIGGWAEQLHGLIEARDHVDVDVLLLDPSLRSLRAFVAEREEVTEKRLSQKRAYRAGGVLVELFIARWTGECYETVWWDHLRSPWPADMGPVVFDGLPVASRAVLQSFREGYPDVIAARPW